MSYFSRLLTKPLPLQNLCRLSQANLYLPPPLLFYIYFTVGQKVLLSSQSHKRNHFKFCVIHTLIFTFIFMIWKSFQKLLIFLEWAFSWLSFYPCQIIIHELEFPAWFIQIYLKLHMYSVPVKNEYRFRKF